MFVWVDTETTGLDYSGPFPDQLLEVGIVVTDDDLSLVAAASWVIFQQHLTLMDDFVFQMHTKSGLMDAIYDQNVALPLETVEQYAIEWLTQQDALGQPMCGSSIAFDRGMLGRHMPKLNDAFHYRSIDVSSFKEYFKRVFPELAYPPTPDDQKAHRASDDILASIDEMKHYTRAIRGDL